MKNRIFLTDHFCASPLPNKALPKSLLGQAITYALNQWDSLTVYLGNGELSIDNNIAERAIKDLVIGRKAWLFADRPEGAQTIAIMHSLVQTAVANGLDPYRYLRSPSDGGQCRCLGRTSGSP